MTGYINKQYTVWCDCAEWDQVSGSMPSCVREWKRKGWIKTKTRGWLCPECAVKYKGVKK